MNESREREAYRMGCRHYGADGGCRDKSRRGDKTGMVVAVDFSCTPDCDCTRMKRFDKRKKQYQL